MLPIIGVKKSPETVEKMKRSAACGIAKRVYFDGQSFESIAQLSREIGVKYTTLCAYLTGANRMPTYFSERGLRFL